MRIYVTKALYPLIVLALLMMCILWIWSYWSAFLIQYSHASFNDPVLKTNSCAVSTAKGRTILSFEGGTRSLSNDRWRPRTLARNPLGHHLKFNRFEPSQLLDIGWDRTTWSRLGFVFYTRDSQSTFRVHIGIPTWLPILVTAIPVFIWSLFRYRKFRRLSRGLCIQCGYDLRSSKDRCPECGVQISVLSPE